MRTWGLPYKGSKSKIVNQIVPLFPKAENLYDLFCGGGAVTHFAISTHRFKNVYMNDVNWMCPTLFKDCLDGKYKDESRWISREDFEELKDKDPYVAFVWSFGNNLREYLYGKDIEPLKKALHYALYFADYSLGKALGFDFSFLDGISTIQRKYTALCAFFDQMGGIQRQAEARKSQGIGGSPQYAPAILHIGTQMQLEHHNRKERLRKIQIGGG